VVKEAEKSKRPAAVFSVTPVAKPAPAKAKPAARGRR
jgi:hypothetical protein